MKFRRALDEKRSRTYSVLKPDISSAPCVLVELPSLFANIMLGYHFSKTKFQRDCERRLHREARRFMIAQISHNRLFHGGFPSQTQAGIVALLPLCFSFSLRDSQPTPFSGKISKRESTKKKDIEKVKLTERSLVFSHSRVS